MTNIVKTKLKQGIPVVGCFVGIYCPSLVEIIGQTGVDFVVIDDEHGAFSHSELENMIRAAENVNLVPIIRTSYDPSSIQKALDRGAKGIQVPMVNTKEDAEAVVRKAKFPPAGQRGAAYSIRAAMFGAHSGKAYLNQADEDTLIVVHIETPQAVANFDEIMSVPGIDVAFLGTTDLSVSMGYKEEGANHPEVQRVVRELFAKGKEKHIHIGTVTGSVEGVAPALQQGAAYLGVVGTSVIMNAFKEVALTWNQTLGQEGETRDGAI